MLYVRYLYLYSHSQDVCPIVVSGSTPIQGFIFHYPKTNLPQPIHERLIISNPTQSMIQDARDLPCLNACNL